MIALVLTGHMRCYEIAYRESFLPYFLNRYNPHVFINTWDEVGFYSGKGYLPARSDGFIQTVEGDRGFYVDAAVINQSLIGSLYRPVVLKIEHFTDIEPTIDARAKKFVNAYTRPKNTISQFYKIVGGIKLVQEYAEQNGITYDLVIRTRPDLVFESVPPYLTGKEFTTTVQRNPKGLGTGDQFHAMSFTNALRFAHIYDDLENLYDYFGYSDPHVFIQKYVTDLGIPIKEISTPAHIMHSPHGPYKEPDTGVEHRP